MRCRDGGATSGATQRQLSARLISDIELGYGLVTPTFWYKEGQCSEGRAKSETATVLESLNVLAPMA